MAHRLDTPAGRPGEDDEGLDEGHPWTTGLFGVLYTVTKEKDGHNWLFVVFRLVLDVLQLWLLMVKPSFGWDVAPDSKCVTACVTVCVVCV